MKYILILIFIIYPFVNYGQYNYSDSICRNKYGCVTLHILGCSQSSGGTVQLPVEKHHFLFYHYFIINDDDRRKWVYGFSFKKLRYRWIMKSRLSVSDRWRKDPNGFAPAITKPTHVDVLSLIKGRLVSYDGTWPEFITAMNKRRMIWIGQLLTVNK